MPCIIGIDEAGYGPNLGPFVMSAVAVTVPDADADLWHLLKAAVRRPSEPDDGRLLVADSKVVYAGGNLHALELGVRSLLGPFPAEAAIPLVCLLEWYCPDAARPLCQEAWYAGDTELPIAADPAALSGSAQQWARACRSRRIIGLQARSVIICTPHFNDILDRWGSKGAVLAQSLGQLLAWPPTADETAPLHYFIDKHGGRNHYAALLQQALGDGMVLAEAEGHERSVYRALGLPRDVRFTFQPRADAAHFCVALASMLSKYLRELLMSEFNRFWVEEVPGLKPTAGYPGDAARFYAAIREAAEKLGIDEHRLWRRK